LADKGYGDQKTRQSINSGSTQSSNEPWDTPIDLDTLPDLPPFPVEKLSDWLLNWVDAESLAMQTPPDLAAMLALAEVGAGLATKFRVTIRDRWSEPTNIFTVVAMPPGERKSAVFADAIKPVQAYEQEQIEKMKPIIAEAASQHRIIEAQLKKIEAKAAREEDASQHEILRDEAKKLAKELAEHLVPEEPQCYCADITPEKLGGLLARQGGRMLLASAEGTAFEIAKGKYSDTANFDVYLKGHAGDPLPIDRVSRDNDDVDRPALSCALAVQPDVIRGLAEQASMRGRGFLARWFYSIPVSLEGTRRIAPPAVRSAVAARFHDCMLKVWELEA